MSTVESQFLESNDFTEFEGEWIAILDKKVVSHAKTLTEVYDKVAELKLIRTPLFHRMPAKDEIEKFIL